MWSYIVRCEADEYRIPWCSINHFAYQLPISHYVGQGYLVHGIDTELLVQHLGVEVLTEAVSRDSLDRCDLAPQGCQLLGIEICFGINEKVSIVCGAIVR